MLLQIFSKSRPRSGSSCVVRAACFTLNIKFIARCDTGVVIDREPHLSRTRKTSFLLAPLAVHVHTGYSALPFYTRTKPLLRLYLKYKNVLIPKLKIFLYFRHL